MELALSNHEELRLFENEIVSRIRNLEFSLAERRVEDAIDRAASASLKAASGIPAGSVRIDGWRHLCSDLVKADAALREEACAGAVFADLVLDNRTSSPGLCLDRSFYGGFEQRENGFARGVGDFPRIGAGRPVCVIGLEPLMALQRAPRTGNPDHFRARVDRLLAGLMLIIKVHKALYTHLTADGLPLPVSIFLETDRSRPESDDLGPHSWSFIEGSAIKILSPREADDVLAERRAQDDSDHQLDINRRIAELRELHRLMRLYPFYRIIGRRRLGDVVTNLLQLWCKSLRIPEVGVDWRTSRAEFERALQTIAGATDVSSVEDALDFRHVDALHRNWLKIAKEHGYAIPQPQRTLFEIALAHSLEFGGPIVRCRWELAEDYSVISGRET
ncbi:hypothetical protein [Methylosinus sp. Sm6]|uniref:hypothetical protein n=1 Tax=Methylosinus sp. Sm6 TaxID=2866948 RepID=UPI001C999DF0|nr:hypothetical protein [Methylosinus sp. Sm6]MBY6243155.1 hypothetical protein [Methylosinus sp. Sm6]